jgi:hypothetical protein
MHACTLHIDLTDLLGYPFTGASTGKGEGGTVVSDVEIRYEWQTSGQFPGNDFTLQIHYRAGAGLVWTNGKPGGGHSANHLVLAGSSFAFALDRPGLNYVHGSKPDAHTGRVLLHFR